MDYEKLIDFIVGEVYKRLNQLPETTTTQRKKAVAFWEKDLTKYHVLHKEYEIIAYDQQLKECDIVILSRLCLRGLYNLSQGSCVSQEEGFILKMMMQGKKVYLLNDGIAYRRYKASAPKDLYNKYVKYEEELVGFGVRIINDLTEIITETKVPLQGAHPSKEVQEMAVEEQIEKAYDIKHKKLISEADLRKIKYSGVTTIIVDQKSIITPLANDFIRTNHLEVKRV